jgi:hypothetical protein
MMTKALFAFAIRTKEPVEFFEGASCFNQTADYCEPMSLPT